MLDLKRKSMSDRLGMYKEISRRSFLKAAARLRSKSCGRLQVCTLCTVKQCTDVFQK